MKTKTTNSTGSTNKSTNPTRRKQVKSMTFEGSVTKFSSDREHIEIPKDKRGLFPKKKAAQVKIRLLE